jgi:hypothetical protein
MAFVSKLILEPRVLWGSWSLGLQLLDQMQTFGILKPFLALIRIIFGTK